MDGIFRRVCRWFACGRAQVPRAFHLAFLRTLEQIGERERIRQQWQAVRKVTPAPDRDCEKTNQSS